MTVSILCQRRKFNTGRSLGLWFGVVGSLLKNGNTLRSGLQERILPTSRPASLGEVFVSRKVGRSAIPARRTENGP